MSKHTPCLVAAGFSLLLGCQSNQRSAPPSGLKLPFEVEIVPKRPFEWDFDTSGVQDQDELLQRVRQARHDKGAGLGCAECVGGKLRVMGRDAFEAVASIVSEWNLLGPLNSKVLAIEAAYLKIELSYLPELAVDWRFGTHTSRVSDIVQYALLSRVRADDLLGSVREDCRGEILSMPKIGLANTQRGYVTVATSHPFAEDYEIGTDGTLAPKMGDASIGLALDLFPYANNDGTVTVNLTSWTCDPASPMVRGRKLRVGLGSNRMDLPVFSIQPRMSLRHSRRPRKQTGSRAHFRRTAEIELLQAGANALSRDRRGTT